MSTAVTEKKNCLLSPEPRGCKKNFAIASILKVHCSHLVCVSDRSIFTLRDWEMVRGASNHPAFSALGKWLMVDEF